MSTPDRPTAAAERTGSTSRRLVERIPARLFGGRVRTSTAALVIVFIGLLLLYGQRSDHYSRIDEENAAASATRTAAPRTTEPAPEFTEPTATSTRSSPSSSPSTTRSSITTPSQGETTESTGDQTPSTTTTAPGLQLPRIPGIVLPGQTPTTTPVR